MIEVKQNDNEESTDDNKIWRSCCFDLNSHCVSYAGQFIFSMSMMGFCAIMLVKANGDCNKSSSYINLLSFMMGKILSSIQSSSSDKK